MAQPIQPHLLPQALRCTPSLDSMLQKLANSKDEKDTELLRAILIAKAAEDQRLARLSLLLQTQYTYVLYMARLKEIQDQQQQQREQGSELATDHEISDSPSSTAPYLSPTLSSQSDASLPSPTSLTPSYPFGATHPFSIPGPALGRMASSESSFTDEPPFWPVSESKRKTLDSLKSLLASRQASKTAEPSAAAASTKATAEAPQTRKSTRSKGRKRARSTSSQTSTSSSSFTEPEVHTPPTAEEEEGPSSPKRVKKEGYSGLTLLLNAAES